MYSICPAQKKDECFRLRPKPKCRLNFNHQAKSNIVTFLRFNNKNYIRNVMALRPVWPEG